MIAEKRNGQSNEETAEARTDGSAAFHDGVAVRMGAGSATNAHFIAESAHSCSRTRASVASAVFDAGSLLRSLDIVVASWCSCLILRPSSQECRRSLLLPSKTSPVPPGCDGAVSRAQGNSLRLNVRCIEHLQQELPIVRCDAANDFGYRSSAVSSRVYTIGRYQRRHYKRYTHEMDETSWVQWFLI